MAGRYQQFANLLNLAGPTITGWNRIEGRPREQDLERSLSFEICDALWMLTRQWQMAELRGEDAASPVCAAIQVSAVTIDKVSSGDGAFEPYDGGLPLEIRAEREHPPLNLRFGLEAGRLWTKSLARALAGNTLSRDYFPEFLAAFPIRAPGGKAADVDAAAYQQVVELYAATAGRAIDGTALYVATRKEALGQAPHPLLSLAPPPSGADRTALEGLLSSWLTSVRARYALDQHSDGGAWQAPALEYKLACSAPGFDGGGRIVLAAREYAGGRLDWHSFDRVGPAAASAPTGGAMSSRRVQSRVERFLPTRASFPGMPAARLWEFENRKTSFGRITAYSTDLARLVFAEFGLAYGNDWYLLPLETEVGRLLQVDGLVVTDAFGERSWIPAYGASAGQPWERWSVYGNADAATGSPDSRFLFVGDVLETLLESEPQEAVSFFRDESANMVFAVENRITLDDGRVADGFEAYQARRAYLDALPAPAPPTSAPPPAPPPHPAQISYRLMIDAIPENWIPFVPVRISGVDNREIQLQRAGLLRDLGMPTPQVAPPRTTILRPAYPAAYFVHEEEVPRSGVEIVQTYQRIRHSSGRAIVWCGRARRSGRGQGSSGLAFDKIVAR
ncbi:MAG TPA: hypothetical protein VIT38_10290 [Allosphingosinicella sp.]